LETKVVNFKKVFIFAQPQNNKNLDFRNFCTMYWTLELASKLEDAPWPASKEELIDYAIRSGAPLEVIENLQEIEDEGEIYESIEDIWPDYPSKDDFFFNEDEY
jgi:hypothetical protein